MTIRSFPEVNKFFTAGEERETDSTAGDSEVRRGLGVGRLAQLWKFFAISAPPREIWTHASGMMPFAFFSHEGSKTRRFRDWTYPLYRTALLGLAALI